MRFHKVQARAVAALAAVLALAAGGPALAWEASAGWALADVGLHDGRGGLVLGLGSRAPLAPAAVDLVYALEYVQLRGAQPTWFSDPVDAFIRDDAVVTLHTAQPVALVEVTAVPLPLPRPYAGFSAVLKLAEEWSEFPGEPSREWGYKDLDFAVHLGLTRRVGPLRLDVRYSRGLTDQLLVDPAAGPAAKAEDPLPGVTDPVAGARLSCWRAAAVLAF